MTEKLERSLTYPLLTLYGLGTILGAGIYVLIGKVAVTSGLYAPLAFLTAAILAGFTGYCYSALSSRFPQSAGEAAYLQEGFGFKPLSTLVGWMVIATGVVSAATIANGFVGYLHVFIPIEKFWAITALLLVLFLIASWGVMESVGIAALITTLEVVGLMMVVLVAGDSLAQLPQRLPELLPSINDGGAYFSILLGAFLAFYAFIGFEDMVNMAEEVKNPEKTLPRAIISVLVLSSALYLLIAVIAVLSTPLADLQQSQAPMREILMANGGQYAPQAGLIISLISLVAVVNGALVQIIMGARVMYGMGRQGLAPSWLAQVSKHFKTPVLATGLISAIVWVLAAALPLTLLAKITSYIIVVVFLLVNLALVRILKKEVEPPSSSMRIGIWVPVVASLMCLLFLGVQTYQILSGGPVAGH